MKKILFILLTSIPFLGCNNSENKNIVNSDDLKKFNFNEIYFLTPSTIEDENDWYWMLPNVDIFLKSNDKIISNGIIQKFEEDEELIEKYISDNVTYKILMKKKGTLISDTNYMISESMELISEHKWVQKEYYDEGILEEYEEYIFFNGDFCKNGIERGYYKNGQLYSDCINYSPDCGDPIIDSPESFNWDGICKEYYISGQIREEVKYNIKEERVIYKRCWDEEGNETECE